MRTTHRVGVALAAATAITCALSWPAAGTQQMGVWGDWVTSWASSPMAATPPDLAAPDDFSSAGFTDTTVRNVMRTSVGGQAARVRLSNVFGKRPVTFDEVDVGIVSSGAALVPGTNHRVTFGGSGAVTLPPGTEVLSDPVSMVVPDQADLAVSLFSRGATGPTTYHSGVQQTNYVSAKGDHAGSTSSAPFTTPSKSWYFVDAVDVRAAASTRGTIAAFGDSITAGTGSTNGANHRWPDYLARRLLSAPPGQVRAVADAGIGGNRILHDSACYGINAPARFARDVLADTHPRYVLMLEGINDIGFSQVANKGCTAPNTNVSAAEIIAGYQYIIAEAHAAGIKIIGGTLTPFQGAGYYSAAGEAKRAAINHWIRTSGAFDGVIDFAKAVQDPDHPLRLRHAYDSGDHLHPNDAGYQAMANAINLRMFLS